MVDEIADGLDTQVASSAEETSSGSEDNANLDGYVPISRMHESNAITRKKSYEKGYQKGRDSFAAEDNREPQVSANSGGGIERSQIKGMIEEEAQRLVSSQRADTEKRQLEDWGRAVESDFLTKSEKFKGENPDFNGKDIVEKASAVAPFAFAHSAGLDNSPAVWDHLLKESPVHLHNLEQMILSGNEYKQKAALDEIKKVSDRIKQNRVGKDAAPPSSPIDHIDQTTHGVGRPNESDFSHFRTMYGRKGK